MDVIKFWARMLSWQNGSDHGRHKVAGTDAMFSKRSRPWTSLSFGHGCSVGITVQTMDDNRFRVIIACRENTANTEGFGTASKGSIANTDSFGTCRNREFADVGTAGATDIFGT